MYNRGYYGYKAEGKDIKTLYTIEYTRDQKVFDIMPTAKFTDDMLDKKQFDYLEDAISFWNTLYYDETVLHVMLFEQILLDGKIVLEQCKDMVVPTVLDTISKQRVKYVETNMEVYKAENEKLKRYLAKYGIDASKIEEQERTVDFYGIKERKF